MDLLGLAGSALPFLHIGGAAAALAVPGLGFLTGSWRLYLGIALAAVILLTIGGMWLRIDGLEVTIARKDAEIATLTASIETTKAEIAQAAALANARAVDELQRRHAAELAVLTKQRDQAKQAARIAADTLKEISRAKDSSAPIADALVPLLVRRAAP